MVEAAFKCSEIRTAMCGWENDKGSKMLEVGEFE